MLQEELSAGDKKKLTEEVASLKKLRDSDQQSWAEEKKKLEAEVKKLKLSLTGAEKKLKAKQEEMDEVIAAKEVATEEAAGEIFSLQQAVYSEHVNGFQKALRQADFWYREVSVSDCRFNVNLDVYDNRMLDVAEISRLRVEQEVAAVGNEEAVAVASPIDVEGVVPDGEDGERDAEDGEEVAEEGNDEVAD